MAWVCTAEPSNAWPQVGSYFRTRHLMTASRAECILRSSRRFITGPTPRIISGRKRFDGFETIIVAKGQERALQSSFEKSIFGAIGHSKLLKISVDRMRTNAHMWHFHRLANWYYFLPGFREVKHDALSICTCV